MLERELQWARLKIQALQEELRLERIKKNDHVGLFGIGSGINCSLMSVTW